MTAKPLHDQDAERAVLGCMLSEPCAVIPNAVSSLQREDFFSQAHQELFRVMVAQFDSLQAVDVITVHARLSDEKLDKKVGSPNYLGDLLNAFATTLNVGAYIERVKKWSLLRTLQRVCHEIVGKIHDGPESVQDLLSEAETKICEIGKAVARSQPVSVAQSVSKYRVRREGIQIGEITPRIPTGIRELDDLSGGLPIPTYGIIGGEMAMGKSALMLAMTSYRAKNGLGAVGIFSAEMEEEDIISRMVADLGAINLRRLAGKIHPQEEEAETWALGQIEHWKVFIDPTTALKPADIRRGTRQMVKAGCNLIFLDNAQLCGGSDSRQERHIQLTEVSTTIQSLYREHEISFVLLVQLKQDAMAKGRLLGRYDLADCAAFQRDARFIIVLNAVEGNHSDEATPLILNLCKFNEGKIGTAGAIFNKATQRIT